jgi:hypothetical protein
MPQRWEEKSHGDQACQLLLDHHNPSREGEN